MLENAALSPETLASVLEQSVDCVKLIDLEGRVLWMNANGLCAMEIDDVSCIKGSEWSSLWPEEAQTRIMASLPAALEGTPVRFDAFCPTAKGSPRWWNVTVSSVKDMDQKHAGFLAISRDITEAEVGRQAMQIAAQELRHRLKNTYAMIASLLFGFARGTPEHESFALDMQDRLISLSAAQALFSTENVPCSIGTLIPALMTPFERPSCEIILRDLPKAFVKQGQADAIALVLGELAVNSAKHGALANKGSIEVTASEQDKLLTLKWIEKSSLAVSAHTRSGGQGLALIERIVRARNGTLAIDWQEFGLIVTLEFKL